MRPARRLRQMIKPRRVTSGTLAAVLSVPLLALAMITGRELQGS